MRPSFLPLAALALAACLAASAVQAQEIYKSVDANGAVLYSAHPQPGAVSSSVVPIQQLTPEQRRAARRLLRQDRRFDARLDASFARHEREWRTADREVTAALQALQRAEHALEAGRAPRAGERLGNVGGGTRLTQEYFDRLGALESRVREARARVDRAYDAREKLR